MSKMKTYRVYFVYEAYAEFEAENDEQAKEIAPTLEPESEYFYSDSYSIEEYEDGAFVREVEE